MNILELEKKRFSNEYSRFFEKQILVLNEYSGFQKMNDPFEYLLWF